MRHIQHLDLGIQYGGRPTMKKKPDHHAVNRSRRLGITIPTVAGHKSLVMKTAFNNQSIFRRRQCKNLDIA
jgi:hypothetical protein